MGERTVALMNLRCISIGFIYPDIPDSVIEKQLKVVERRLLLALNMGWSCANDTESWYERYPLRLLRPLGWLVNSWNY